MDNKDFEKQKRAHYEKQLSEQAALESLQKDAREAHGKDIPPELEAKQKEQRDRMSMKHNKETKAFFEKHTGISYDAPQQDKAGVSKTKDKDKDREKDKD